MKKIITLGAAVAFALMASTASAASISNPLFSNGDTSISTTGGSTVNGTFTLTVGSNEVCEVLRTWDDSQPFTDSTVGDSNMGYQEGVYTNVPFTVKVPVNTSTASAYAQCAGIYGGIHSVSGADNIVAGPTNLGTVRVVAGGTTSTGSGSSTESLAALVAALTAQVQALLHPVAPVVSTKCAALAEHMGGTMFGVKNQANVTLQGYLLGEGASIPALAAGASFGFWGPQTQAALTAFKAANSCI